MKTPLKLFLIPVLFTLISSSAFAGYWKCENTFIVGEDCLLTVTYEVWWDDQTGEITGEKTSSSCDCCTGASGPGKAFTSVRNLGTTSYDASDFRHTSTGDPELSLEDMEQLWNDHIGPWASTLDHNNPATCE